MMPMGAWRGASIAGTREPEGYFGGADRQPSVRAAVFSWHSR
jgi:hypothetical protein